MKITEVGIAQLTIPLIRPFITAVRRTEFVDDIVVLLKTDNGKVGYGSAAPTPAITGDSKESIIHAIKNSARQLIGRDIRELNALLQMNNQSMMGNSSAQAAIDIALHDLFAQYCAVPLYRLLGGRTNTISTCITISVKAVADMVADAHDLVSQGYCSLKIKVGLNPVEDIERVQAIRDAVGSAINLLVDANQGWSCTDALQVIQHFEQQHLHIALVEQPTIAHDLQQLKQLSEQLSSPIIADESCFSAKDALNIAKMNACDGINIKLMKSGGLENAKAIYTIATTVQMQVMVGCMLESPIGIAAMASFALSKPDIVYADLDPICLIKENYVQGGAQLRANQIILSDKPGLGIEQMTEGLTLIGTIR